MVGLPLDPREQVFEFLLSEAPLGKQWAVLTRISRHGSQSVRRAWPVGRRHYRVLGKRAHGHPASCGIRR